MPSLRLLCIGMLFLFAAGPMSAQIASPGKLSNAHAKLEGVNNCSQCHNFGEKSFRGNCLNCHTEIRTRVDSQQGYHYFTRKLECSKCHKEHHGRNFELVRWDPTSFDHKQTNFVLEGKHGSLKCRECHTASNIKAADIRRKGSSVLKRTYLGLSPSCDNCHEDEHRGQLKDCASCHGMDGWKQTRFTHDRARFRLEGKHAQAACEKCHPEKDDAQKRNGDTRYMQFKGISFNACTACHEDNHKGAFGKECQKCHSPVGWKQLRIAEGSFDHTKTHFPLEGRHAAVACARCHTGGDFGKFKNVDLKRCTACHNDYHAGQFADRPDKGACEACHTVQGFTPSGFEFAQHIDTRFPLRGAHEAIPCGRCHVHEKIEGKETLRFTWTDLSCQSCHKDPHAGQFDTRIAQQGCSGCHDVDSWHVMQFDHSGTGFPLTGLHRDLLCEKCHVQGTVGGKEAVIFRIADTRCDACHEDRHQGQFAAADGRVDCARCHETYGWRRVRFDHATMSRFSLSGRHETVPCGRCHINESREGKTFVRYRPLDFHCSSCHTTGR
ncbi:MAG: cytochrome C [Bacteroidetes bacterium]|nr:cytochrome C [Bacteroidota bacterium]